MCRRVGNSPYRQRSDVARVRGVMLEAAAASKAPRSTHGSEEGAFTKAIAHAGVEWRAAANEDGRYCWPTCSRVDDPLEDVETGHP